MTTTKVNTNWTKATTNPIVAISGLLSALEHNKSAWIEIRKNGDQSNPIVIKNPELDNPFNWTMSYGVPSKPEYDHSYFNETEKDLTLNWTACFGEKDAIEKYQKEGILTKGVSKGIGIAHPVRKSDVVKLRPDLEGVNLWTTHWKPKEGISHWVTDPSINEVYVICTSQEEQDKNKSIKSAIDLLNSLLKD